MRITKLSVTGLRALKQADFEFQPGMNLLVGVNGVGKTTVIDALRICLSKLIPDVLGVKISKQYLEKKDICFGMDVAQISCDFTYLNNTFNLLFTKRLEKTLIKDTSTNREEYIEVPEIEKITPEIQKLSGDNKATSKPLGIFFSTKRSVLVDQKVSTTSTSGGQSVAFAESLSENRDFNLRIFAQWYKVQEEIGTEKSIALKHISVLKSALERFLPEFSNLHVIDLNGVPQLRIEKNGSDLDLKQLSDGERGVLSLVFDIARRLSQANSELADPLTDGKAIVLIDELDLHLHPKWQRTIVENLTRTFPNCQFIATTHSPQIIPSVEPEQVILLKDNEVILPDRTKGMDSNWILKFLMDSEDRPKDATEAIEKVEKLINENKFKEARDCIAEFKANNIDLTEWPMFEARMSRLEVFSKPK